MKFSVASAVFLVLVIQSVSGTYRERGGDRRVDDRVLCETYVKRVNTKQAISVINKDVVIEDLDISSVRAQSCLVTDCNDKQTRRLQSKKCKTNVESVTVNTKDGKQVTVQVPLGCKCEIYCSHGGTFPDCREGKLPF